MASRETEHVEAGAPDSSGEVAARVAYDSLGAKSSSTVGSEPEAVAEGEGANWYAVWLYSCAWAGVIALVLLASSCVEEARASEPTRIWTPAEMSAWAAKLDADKEKAAARDCVRRGAIDKACLQTLWYGYDLTRTQKTGGGQ